ncbi:MAG: hypothetical protein KGV46_02735 [Pasteurella sp.]|nr:hypothetical protein [Pasteurella sp.]
MIKKLFTTLFVVATLFIVGCERDATIASKNLSTDADQFRVKRHIVFYNAIKDSYMLEITGNCSIKNDSTDNQLEVICKVGDNKYQKHFLGLSDNVSYIVEQLDYSESSKYHYKRVFKPQNILPFQNISVE